MKATILIVSSPLKRGLPDGEMYYLIMCKGIRSHEYYNPTSMLIEEKLMPIEAFYDSLHDRQCITANDEFAKKVWAKGGCKNEED